MSLSQVRDVSRARSTSMQPVEFSREGAREETDSFHVIWASALQFCLLSTCTSALKTRCKRCVLCETCWSNRQALVALLLRKLHLLGSTLSYHP